MTDSVKRLVEEFDCLQRRIASYDYALNLMTYDSQTAAPAGAASTSGIAQSSLFEERRELACGNATGELIEQLSAHVEELDETHLAELRQFRRSYEEDKRIPLDLASEYKSLIAESFPTWRRAKEENDYPSFEPFLTRIITSLREQAKAIDPDAQPYDVWLDRWERGCSMSVCDRFFQQVGETVVPLVREIGDRCAADPSAQVDDSFAHEEVDEADQQRLAWDLAQVIGLDSARLSFSRTEHPFTIAFGRDDVRIAHHFNRRNVLDGVCTTIHEGGHSLYEQSVDSAYEFTCLSGGASAGIHESQSRLMENMVGRSRPFMEVLLPLLCKHAPGHFDEVDAETLYRACNVVRPSLIRTAADELTYPLHILVRYECEKKLFAGDVSAADIPGLWHDLMAECLGIEVPDDTHGCLQDMHWAADFVGYFTSYALGNAYAAQFMAHARGDWEARAAMAGSVDGFEARIASGDLTPVTGWLRERIWRHGRRLDPQDLIAQACGEPFDPSYYTRYLAEKYTGLYGL